MLNETLQRDSLFWIVHQHLLDQIFDFFGNVGPFLLRVADALTIMEELIILSMFLGIFVRILARRHLIQDHAHGEDLTPAVITLLELFRGHIPEGSALLCNFAILLGIVSDRSSPINQLYQRVAVFDQVHHDILWLDIAVNDRLAPLAIPDGVNQLLHDHFHLQLGHSLLLVDIVYQLTVVAILEDDFRAKFSIVVINVEDLNDIRIVQLKK